MATQIEEPKAGESTAELWRTVKELVKAVNALNSITLSPTGLGKVQYADGNVVIAFNTESCA